MLLFKGAAGQPVTLQNLADPADLELFDMDNDKDLDLVVAQTGTAPGIYILENKNGSLGSSGLKGPFPLGIQNPIQIDIEISRMDSDPLPDVVAGVTPMFAIPLPPSEIRMLPGKSLLSLGSPRKLYSGKGFLDITIGNTKNDNLRDLAVLDCGNDAVMILEN